MAVNVLGPWLCASAVTPVMRQQGGGRIINIASVIAHLGIPFMLHYVASKGGRGGNDALDGARTRRYKIRHHRCNAISPGYIHSRECGSEQGAARTIRSGVGTDAHDRARPKAGRHRRRSALARERRVVDGQRTKHRCGRRHLHEPVRGVEGSIATKEDYWRQADGQCR
ncbi:SDR family NAD(P)-dependent oxidoreductase [Cupriavidus basilensis]